MGKIREIIDNKRHSLKFILIFYYVLIFIIFIGGFEIFTYLTLRDYYYNNLKSNMISQSAVSVDLYESSIAQYTLSEVILNERFEFTNNMQGQVQILDNTGMLYYDNTGSDEVGKVIEDASRLTSTNFRVDTKENTMILNYPLRINGTQLGVLRTITSLQSIHKEIALRMNLFLIFGLLTIITGSILIYYIGDKILTPINQLISLANKLSDGQYKEKSNMSYEGEVGELAKTMDELSENIIKKEEIKTDFISSVSHELRTPLTSIKGWAITLQDSEMDGETLNEGLRIIEKEADRLTDMVEDLLDFSRYTSPQFSLNKAPFDIVPVVKNIINQLKPRTKEKNIDMIFDFNKENITIVADDNRLKQVFINLIDNAIKFTEDNGTIIVTINDEGQNLKCQVIDTGIGISEEEIDLVTTKFFKGSTSASHTGLGLSICEEIIMRHNGELEISSKVGVGTNISFTIPKGVNNEEN